MLPAGHGIGPYVVVSPLGSGGMGEVYLADDTRLRRRVALKVLPADAADVRRASERLLREARAAARLDHANICTIFDTGEADGQAYIAMQYVEGESLAVRLKRKPLDLGEALALAAEAAHALAEAHQQGVVHRDIKPQNVMVTTSGHAKVLDFGLAQTMGPMADQATTIERLTEAGAVAGTVRYMSPEQVKGETVDERSDIFSLGAVLYEMVARAHPFGDGGMGETIVAILTRDPAPLGEGVPAEVRRIIARCLEKDRTRRYHTARDLAVDLENAARPAASGAPAKRGGPRGAWVAAAGLVLVAGAAAIWSMRSGRSAPQPGPSDYVPITDFADAASAPALSPDGRMVAFIRGSTPFLNPGEIYVKLLPNGEAKQLTHDPRAKYGPAFTPDGSRVAYTVHEFQAGWETWTVPVLGGEPTRLLPNAAGLTWIDERHLLFSEIKGDGLHMGLVTSTVSRSERREIYFPAHERAMAHYSALSPDRASVLVVQMSGTGGWASCRVVPFDGSSAGQDVGPPGACRGAAWSPDGRWMYLSIDAGATSHIWRQRFPNGAPEPVTSGPTTDEQGVAMAPDGRSIVTSVGRRSSALWWHDAAGERLLSSEGYAWAPRLSPDGARIFLLLQRASSPDRRLAVMDPATTRTELLLPDVSVGSFDISPDGRRVAYAIDAAAGGSEVWVAAVDRTSAPRRVTANADLPAFVSDDELVVRALEGHANFLDRIKVDGTARARVQPAPILDVDGVSPDGRWAIIHLASGSHRTVLLSLAGDETRRLCDTVCRAAWTTDRRSLFIIAYMRGRTLVVPVPAGRTFPEFPTADLPAAEAWQNLPGRRLVDGAQFAPGADAFTYAFTKREELRNLFRIPIR